MSPQQARRGVGLHPVPRWYPGRGTHFVLRRPSCGSLQFIKTSRQHRTVEGSTRPTGDLTDPCCRRQAGLPHRTQAFQSLPAPCRRARCPVRARRSREGRPPWNLRPSPARRRGLPVPVVCRYSPWFRKAANCPQLSSHQRVRQEDTCRYENIKDLPKIMQPGDYMLSLDCAGALGTCLFTSRRRTS